LTPEWDKTEKKTDKNLHHHLQYQKTKHKTQQHTNTAEMVTLMYITTSYIVT